MSQDNAIVARDVSCGGGGLMGCREAFPSDPERYLAQIRDVVICPGCLAEKPAAVMVPVEYQGTLLHLCGCPGCSAALERDPERLLARLAV